MATERIQFARQDAPPKVTRVPPILRIGAKDRGAFAICSVRPQGYWNHWDDGRTYPCIQGTKLCKRCLKKVPRSWRGFLYVTNSDGTGGSFLEITTLGLEDLDKLYGVGESFRGFIIHVERSKGLRSPLKFDKLGAVPLHLLLPIERDVLPTLKRVWRFENLD